jgi:hypothetical protein
MGASKKVRRFKLANPIDDDHYVVLTCTKAQAEQLCKSAPTGLGLGLRLALAYLLQRLRRVVAVSLRDVR